MGNPSEYRPPQSKDTTQTENMVWVFIHVPKTGGSSIAAALGHKIRGPVDTELGHMFAKTARDEYGRDPKQMFAVVRNPYDRAVSLYGQLVKGNHVMTPELVQDFWKDDRIPTGKHPDYGYVPLPQTNFLYDGDKKIVDTLLRFEYLEQEILEMFGVPIPHQNKNKCRRDADYRVYYNDELQETIYRHYRADFDNFGYPPDL